MTKIIVKNGDWDKARAELGANMDAKKKSFDAQFEATFGAARKPAAAQPSTPAGVRPVPSSGKLVLARSTRR